MDNAIIEYDYVNKNEKQLAEAPNATLKSLQSILPDHENVLSRPWSPIVVFKAILDPANIIARVTEYGSVKTPRGKKATIVLNKTTVATSGRKDKDYIKRRYVDFVERVKGVDKAIKSIRSCYYIPDTFILTVGVVDRSIIHQSIDGTFFIPYDDLFAELFSKGYDPLQTLRKKHSLIESAMIKIINQIIAGGSKRLPDGVRFKSEAINRISEIGIKLVHDAQDYIYGGLKPTLRGATMSIRKEKKKEHPELYQGKSGIREPLVESMQLHDAIEYKVYATQSPMMRAVLKSLKDEYDEIKKSININRVHRWSAKTKTGASKLFTKIIRETGIKDVVNKGLMNRLNVLHNIATNERLSAKSRNSARSKMRNLRNLVGLIERILNGTEITKKNYSADTIETQISENRATAKKYSTDEHGRRVVSTNDGKIEYDTMMDRLIATGEARELLDKYLNLYDRTLLNMIDNFMEQHGRSY